MVQALDPGTDIEKLKGDWGAQSTTEFGHTVKVWAIPIALLGFTLFVIFSTTAMFRESVKARGIPGSPHPGIWLPLIVQLLLFLITAPAAAAITGLPLFSLVAVIQLGVWLYELVLLFTS